MKTIKKLSTILSFCATSIISIGVNCWLWSLIFHIQRYYSFMFVTQVYYTLIPPALGFGGQHPQEMGVRSPREIFLGCVLAKSIADPWYWVNPRIFPLYFPYKREHCKSTGYGIVLYWKRDCESVKRKSNGFAAGCIPTSF